jgi:transcriptional regulator with PAS, ATPase and Fis domain
VLVLDGAPEALAERALVRLAPLQVLTRPASAALLRYVVRRALPSEAPGAGARPHHRPTPALLGVSSAIREVMDQVRQIAPTHIPVLILGETGTGKELVARAIHEQSPRRDLPFVAVNCGAMPDALLESELFGHRRGSFTGADRDKTGLFEFAHGGTVFLDEIGDTSQAMQMKLLRVLESCEIRPLGGTQTISVDVRVVSATNRDLETAIEAGSFRQDLYYRLNTVTIYVPPLRRRRVDIPFLAQHFAEEFGAGHARRIVLAEDFLESLSQRDFPGNVRELRNAVERAIALAAPGEPVSSEHLEPPRTVTGAGFELEGPLKELVDRVEAAAIRAALQKSGGNRRRAAEALGLTRPGLRYKMRRLGLDDSEA